MLKFIFLKKLRAIIVSNANSYIKKHCIDHVFDSSDIHHYAMAVGAYTFATRMLDVLDMYRFTGDIQRPEHVVMQLHKERKEVKHEKL